MKNRTALIALLLSIIIAVLFLFLHPKTIISWGLGWGRHNDRVLVGTLGLLVAIISAYRLARPSR